MKLIVLMDIEFTPYIPTTLLGLLGLVSAYLYFYFKNKDDNKLKSIQSTNPEDRLRAIELNLSELGVTIDTGNLKPTEKYKLLVKALIAKTRKYLIIATVLIVLAAIIGFLFYDKSHSPIMPSQNTNDSLNKSKIIINGDKIEGDKVGGDKVNGDKIIKK